MAFTPINTQEEFDAAISERIKREREKYEKQYSDYESLKGKASQADSLQKQLEQANAQLLKTQIDLGAAKDQLGSVAELTARAAAAEKKNLQYKIAADVGIPLELAGRLNGEDEAAMRADAESIIPLLAKNHPVQPLFKPDEHDGNGANPYSKLLKQMKE